MDKRPALHANTSIQDFKDYYWYKKELIDFCRTWNLDKRGGKLEVASRIEKFLETGEQEPYMQKCIKTSDFNWNTEKLTPETKITNSYKNTENVRAFFKSQIGKSFKFNVEFMNWMKSAQGKTLGEAIAKWISITNEKRTEKSIKQIAPQFEYNSYIRDYMNDNRDKTLHDAIECWNIKKSKPGNNKYSKSDLK